MTNHSKNTEEGSNDPELVDPCSLQTSLPCTMPTGGYTKIFKKIPETTAINTGQSHNTLSQAIPVQKRKERIAPKPEATKPPDAKTHPKIKELRKRVSQLQDIHNTVKTLSAL